MIYRPPTKKEPATPASFEPLVPLVVGVAGQWKHEMEENSSGT